MPGYCIAQLKNKSAEQISFINTESVDAKTITAHHDQPLDALRKACDNRQLLCILPADEVVILQAKLPQGIKTHRLQLALPFALQDQLADKSELYHFVPLGSQDEKGHITVAVMAQTHLQAWQSWLKEQQLHADALLPAVFSLPYQKNAITVLINNNKALVRTQPDQGFFCDTPNLTMMLDTCLQQQPVDTVQVYKRQNDKIELALKAEKKVNIDYQQQTNQAYEEMITKECIAMRAYNLLTGKFRASHKQNKVNKLWLTSVVLVALIILIALINMIVRYSVYQQQNNKLTTQIDAIYKRNFPNSTSIVAPKERMQQKLKTQTGGSEANAFLSLLGKSGMALRKTTGINVQSLGFNNNTLHFSVQADNFAAINQLSMALQQQQLTINTNNARTLGKHVSTDMIIKEDR